MARQKITCILLCLLYTPQATTTVRHHKNNSIIRQKIDVARSERSQDDLLSNSFSQNCSCRITHKSPLDQCVYDISFGIADIKYDNNSLKILELGEGTRSMFAGYERIYGEGSMWKKIWSFLITNMKTLSNEIEPSIFFVDDQLLNQSNRKTISIMTLMQRGDIAVQTIEELTHHRHFIQTQNYQPAPENTFTPKHPMGLIVIRHNSAQEKQIQKFFSQTEHLLLCNAAIAPFVNNKKNTDNLFFGPLRIHRPYTKIVAKSFATQASSTILIESQAKEFVIKPTTASQGEGIIFTPRKKLAKTLATLFGPQQRGPKTLNDAERYWQNDTELEFIVESCESSKPITVDNSQYDATLRIVYGLTHTNQTVKATILGSYWKLPSKPLDSISTLQEKKLSHISKKKISAAPVTSEDEAVIHTIFLPIITTIYDQMLPSSGRSL